MPVGATISVLVLTGPVAHPATCAMGTGSFLEGKERPVSDADPSSLTSGVGRERVKLTSTPYMGRKDCTEPQCLYKGALYLLPLPKSEHKCFRNTEERNCCSETTDSTTYWYVTSYTYTAARTPNIRAFHKQSFNLAITN
jgi:hypothetical protein